MEFGLKSVGVKEKQSYELCPSEYARAESHKYRFKDQKKKKKL